MKDIDAIQYDCKKIDLTNQKRPANARTAYMVGVFLQGLTTLMAFTLVLFYYSNISQPYSQLLYLIIFSILIEIIIIIVSMALFLEVKVFRIIQWSSSNSEIHDYKFSSNSYGVFCAIISILFLILAMMIVYYLIDYFRKINMYSDRETVYETTLDNYERRFMQIKESSTIQSQNQPQLIVSSIDMPERKTLSSHSIVKHNDNLSMNSKLSLHETPQIESDDDEKPQKSKSFEYDFINGIRNIKNTNSETEGI